MILKFDRETNQGNLPSSFGCDKMFIESERFGNFMIRMSPNIVSQENPVENGHLLPKEEGTHKFQVFGIE